MRFAKKFANCLPPQTVSLEAFTQKPTKVADFQREFEWTDNMAASFGLDLIEQAMAGHTMNVLGTLHTYESEDGSRYVVDGQQRLTTLMLLTMAIWRVRGRDTPTDLDYEGLLVSKTRLGVGQPLNTVCFPHTPEADAMYAMLSAPGAGPFKVTRESGLPAKSALSTTAATMLTVAERLRREVERLGLTPIELDELVRRIYEGVHFTVHEHPSRLAAIKAYERTNTNVKKLHNADLLKNRTFELAEVAGTTVAVRAAWEEVRRSAAEIGSRSKVRLGAVVHAINGRHGTAAAPVTETNLLSWAEVNLGDELEFCTQLAADVRLAAEFQRSSTVRGHVDARFEGLASSTVGARLSHLPVVVAMSHLSPELCAHAALRLWLINLQLTHCNLRGSESTAVMQPLVENLRSCAPDDTEAVDAAFDAAHEVLEVESGDLRVRLRGEAINKATRKSLLAAVAAAVAAPQHRNGALIAALADEIDVEHICPQHDVGWNPSIDGMGPGLESSVPDAVKNCLGNLTLLPATRNRSVGNSGFMEKRRVYGLDNSCLTRALGSGSLDGMSGPERAAVEAAQAHVAVWDAKAIHDRAAWMAEVVRWAAKAHFLAWSTERAPQRVTRVDLVPDQQSVSFN